MKNVIFVLKATPNQLDESKLVIESFKFTGMLKMQKCDIKIQS